VTAEEFVSRLGLVKRSGNGWMARCPAHEDRHASLAIGEGDDGRVLVNCHAGCTAEQIVAAMGIAMRDLFPDRGRGGVHSPRTPATVQHPVSDRGCTLEDYASAKGLPVPSLESWGVAEMRYLGAPAVRFPYLNEAGEEISVRFRVALAGDARVRTKAGAKHFLYGLNKLASARERGYILLVEGESDTHTLWLAGYPALGLPGANGWNEDRDAGHLEDIPAVYVFIEPDRGGEAVLRWISTSSIRERVRLISLANAKDVSDLYLDDRERFSERLETAIHWRPWPRTGGGWE
jgi:putative DNA primase/helicase